VNNTILHTVNRMPIEASKHGGFGMIQIRKAELGLPPRQFSFLGCAPYGGRLPTAGQENATAWAKRALQIPQNKNKVPPGLVNRVYFLVVQTSASG
jgi:hypothetical protein